MEKKVKKKPSNNVESYLTWSFYDFKKRIVAGVVSILDEKLSVILKHLCFDVRCVYAN